MNSWLRHNVWTLAIAAAGIVATFAVGNYRIDVLEKEVADDQQAVAALNDTNVQVQVTLAKIQTDIEYIKTYVTKLAN